MLGLEKPNSGPDPGETFFPNSVSDLGSAETFPKSRNVGPVIDENVCLLDSQPCPEPSTKFYTFIWLQFSSEFKIGEHSREPTYTNANENSMYFVYMKNEKYKNK